MAKLTSGSLHSALPRLTAHVDGAGTSLDDRERLLVLGFRVVAQSLGTVEGFAANFAPQGRAWRHCRGRWCFCYGKASEHEKLNTLHLLFYDRHGSLGTAGLPLSGLPLSGRPLLP